jgi:fatty acid desaturase
VISAFIGAAIFIRWHSVGEHTGVNEDLEQDKTLTHQFPWIVNFFLYPIQSCFHLEYHLFPQIPWYQMKKFRLELMKISYYQTEASKQTVDGYFWGQKTVRQTIFKKPF